MPPGSAKVQGTFLQDYGPNVGAAPGVGPGPEPGSATIAAGVVFCDPDAALLRSMFNPWLVILPPRTEYLNRI